MYKSLVAKNHNVTASFSWVNIMLSCGLCHGYWFYVQSLKSNLSHHWSFSESFLLSRRTSAQRIDIIFSENSYHVTVTVPIPSFQRGSHPIHSGTLLQWLAMKTQAAAVRHPRHDCLFILFTTTFRANSMAASFPHVTLNLRIAPFSLPRTIFHLLF